MSFLCGVMLLIPFKCIFYSCVSSCSCFGLFKGVAGREMQALDILLIFWCTQALIPSIQTSQGQQSYGRITEELEGSLMWQVQQFPTQRQTLTYTSSLSQGWHFLFFSSFSLFGPADYSGIQWSCGIPMGFFRGLVSRKSLLNKPSALGCCCSYSALGHPCTSSHVPASLDCPRKLGSIWPTVSTCFWADLWWLFPGVI